MKPDYKNWMPIQMIMGFSLGAVIFFILSLIFKENILAVSQGWNTVLFLICFILTIVMALISVYMYMLYRAFDYNGGRKLSKEIIEKTAKFSKVVEEGKVLDIGCGSGALTIAVAKENPKSYVIGLDRWGKEYASFNKELCEINAKIEDVSDRTEFIEGNAVKLPFEDESFDAIVSNYCIHNIPLRNRQEILLEALRTLKKGGTFALHDIYSNGKYGDMNAFIDKLKSKGYEKVELIDTTDKFMKKREAKLYFLNGSGILYGRK